MRAVPLHSANHLYLRTPPVGNHSYLAMHRTNFPTFPRSYVRLMQPIRIFFVQKYIFSSKNLRMCIFCSTFAAAFVKGSASDKERR